MRPTPAQPKRRSAPSNLPTYHLFGCALTRGLHSISPSTRRPPVRPAAAPSRRDQRDDQPCLNPSNLPHRVGPAGDTAVAPAGHRPVMWVSYSNAARNRLWDGGRYFSIKGGERTGLALSLPPPPPPPPPPPLQTPPPTVAAAAANAAAAAPAPAARATFCRWRRRRFPLLAPRLIAPSHARRRGGRGLAGGAERLQPAAAQPGLPAPAAGRPALDRQLPRRLRRCAQTPLSPRRRTLHLAASGGFAA